MQHHVKNGQIGKGLFFSFKGMYYKKARADVLKSLTHTEKGKGGSWKMRACGEREGSL